MDTRQCEPGECIPIDDARAPYPHVRCAECGTLAEPVSPAELETAWAAMLAARPVRGQVSWLE